MSEKSERRDFGNEIGQLAEQYRHRREERQQSQARQRLRVKRLGWFAVMGFVVFCAGTWKGHQWYQEFVKGRLADRFLQAVLNKDGKTLCDLTAPEDREELGLTPEKAAAVVERLFALLGEAKPLRVEKEPVPENAAFPEERVWQVYWGDKTTGKPLPGALNPEKGLFSNVLVVVVKSGFWVDFYGFIYSTCCARWGRDRGLQMTRYIAREAGLTLGRG